MSWSFHYGNATPFTRPPSWHLHEEGHPRRPSYRTPDCAHHSCPGGCSIKASWLLHEEERVQYHDEYVPFSFLFSEGKLHLFSSLTHLYWLGLEIFQEVRGSSSSPMGSWQFSAKILLHSFTSWCLPLYYSTAHELWNTVLSDFTTLRIYNSVQRMISETIRTKNSIFFLTLE